MDTKNIICDKKPVRNKDYHGGTSFPEQFLFRCIKQIFPKTENRKLDDNLGLEFDIYVPEVDLRIEYNGSFYHVDENRQNLDSLKVEYCRDNNMKFVHIIEDNSIKKIEKEINGNYLVYYIKNQGSYSLIMTDLASILNNILAELNIEPNIELDYTRAFYEAMAFSNKYEYIINYTNDGSSIKNKSYREQVEIRDSNNFIGKIDNFGNTSEKFAIKYKVGTLHQEEIVKTDENRIKTERPLIKREEDYYERIKRLNIRTAELEARNQELIDKETELNIMMQEVQKQKQEYESLLKEEREKNEEIQDKANEIERKRCEYDAKLSDMLLEVQKLAEKRVKELVDKANREINECRIIEIEKFEKYKGLTERSLENKKKELYQKNLKLLDKERELAEREIYFSEDYVASKIGEERELLKLNYEHDLAILDLEKKKFMDEKEREYKEKEDKLAVFKGKLIDKYNKEKDKMQRYYISELNKMREEIKQQSHKRISHAYKEIVEQIEDKLYAADNERREKAARENEQKKIDNTRKLFSTLINK